MSRFRNPLLFLCDSLILLGVALALSIFSLRYGLPDAVGQGLLLKHLLVLYACTAVFQLLFHTYDSLWRYAESREYLSLSMAAFCGFLSYEVISRTLMDGVISFILLNSPHWRCDIDPAFWDIIKHPAYTGKADDGTGLISAFNLVTEEGLAYYRAFIAFLTDRYTREDMAYGRVVGMIVSNEVDAGYIWANSGEMTLEEYVTEYATALRVTWQTAASIYANMRVFVSIDHFWTAAMDENQPLRYYKTRDMLVFLNELAAEQGQIPWHIAHHPYPEDLNYPDFWNDKLATPDDDAPIITFKNLEVLARFIHRPEFLLNGERRRIILSEQGFNSHWTPESEILQACAYGRAYRKIMEIPEIDSFILHSHHDNAFEFGLNLGLWRRKKEGHGMEAPKPMYYVFKAIDQKDEKGVYHWERY